MTNLAVPGLILKGRTPSNVARRTKVWAVHPTNPKRVLLWSKGGKFSWAHVSSLEVNYEPAGEGEPTWPDPDPRREPPADPNDAPRPATPVETAAAAPDPVDDSETIGPEAMVEEALPFDKPAPPPPPPPMPPLAKTMGDGVIRLVITGDAATRLTALVDYLRSTVRVPGVRISPDSLVQDLIDREYNSTVRTLVERELAAAEGKVA
jgi:hypothetical protein